MKKIYTKKYILRMWLFFMFFLCHIVCKAEDKIQENHEMVDLGLSVNWSTCNLGALDLYDCGYSLSWGETEEKKVAFFVDTYKLSKRGKMIKYCFEKKFGRVDNKITLDKSDDIAALQWGNAWRIPTIIEFEELIDNCVSKWCTDYDSSGVSGMLFVSKLNGNCIFFPACGYKVWGCDLGQNIDGAYWTSNLNPMSSRTSFYFHFEARSQEIAIFDRFWGCFVRPVSSKLISLPNTVGVGTSKSDL